MHRRFAHLNSNIIIKLYEVITYSLIRRSKHKISCSTCAVEKMKKKINRVVTLRKKNILNLISIDACESLSKSLVKNIIFLEIVDNYSRKIWTICTKDRKSISVELDTWKTIMELQTGRKLKVIRLDNALELLSIVRDWVKKYDLILQDIESYTSHQNGVVERSIQITENSIRAIMKNLDLSLEFWDEAAMINAYLRNRIVIESLINEKSTSLE